MVVRLPRGLEPDIEDLAEVLLPGSEHLGTEQVAHQPAYGGIAWPLSLEGSGAPAPEPDLLRHSLHVSKVDAVGLLPVDAGVAETTPSAVDPRVKPRQPHGNADEQSRHHQAAVASIG